MDERKPMGDKECALLKKKRMGNGAGVNKNINRMYMNTPIGDYNMNQSKADKNEQ